MIVGLCVFCSIFPFILILYLYYFNTMAWNVNERAHAVEIYFQHRSWTRALRALRQEWGRRRVPTRLSLASWVRQFRERGSVAGAQSRVRGTRTPRTVINRVRRAIHRKPNLSVRRLSNITGVSKSTIHRILRRELRLYPYKLQLTQRLRRGDKAKRVRFCRWLLDKWKSPSFRRHLFVSDEAHFYLNGCVNKQNCRVWGNENPHALVEQDHQPSHVTVWCGLTSRGVIGPYYFQSRGRTETVTGARYKRMLDDFVVPELRRLGISLRRVWFQQDGASPHTTGSVLTRLRQIFPGKVISKNGDVNWPPRSPDLSPLDFFLWGHLKNTIYTQPVHSLGQLRARISASLATLPGSTLRSAMENLALRCRSCLQKRGAHMEHVLIHE